MLTNENGLPGREGETNTYGHIDGYTHRAPSGAGARTMIFAIIKQEFTQPPTNLLVQEV